MFAAPIKTSERSRCFYRLCKGFLTANIFLQPLQKNLKASVFILMAKKRARAARRKAGKHIDLLSSTFF
jgi:hypothetical protein